MQQPPNPAAPSSPPSIPSVSSSDPAPVPEGEIVIQRGGVAVTEVGLSHDINVLKDAIEIWAGMLANKGIKVYYRGTECFAYPGMIVLPEVTLLEVRNPTPERLKEVSAYLEALRGQVVHEVAHHLFSDFEDQEIFFFINSSPAAKVVQNGVEDVFCERRMEDEWPGTGLDLKNLNEWIFREHVRPENWPKLGAFARVLYGWMVRAQYGDDHWFYRGMSDQIKGVISTLDPETAAVRTISSSKETLPIAKAILEKLKLADKAPQQPPPKPQKGDKKSDKKGNPAPGGDEGKPKGEKTKGKKTKGKKGSKKKGKNDKDAPSSVSLPDPSGPPSPPPPPPGMGGGNPTGQQVGQQIAAGDLAGMKKKSEMISGFMQQDARKPLDRQGKYLIYTTEYDRVGPVDKILPPTTPPHIPKEQAVTVERFRYQNVVREAETSIGVLKRRIRSLLTEESRPLHHYEQEEGDLDMEHLYRAALPNTGNKLFVRTTEITDTKEVAVALVINESGSMGEYAEWKCDGDGKPTEKMCLAMWETNEKLRKKNPTTPPARCLGHKSTVNNITLAQRTAIMFGEVLEAIGTSFRIVGHCALGYPPSVVMSHTDHQMYTRCGALKMIEYKGWNERFEVVRHKLMRITAGGGTFDGEALVRAAHDISKRRERRKIIFMLDDGIPQPAGGHKEAHQDYFYRSIRQVMAAGIEVIGLGMGIEGVRRYYPNCVVIKKIEDTPQIAAQELKRLLSQKPKEARFI